MTKDDRTRKRRRTFGERTGRDRTDRATQSELAYRPQDLTDAYLDGVTDHRFLRDLLVLHHMR